MTLWWAIVALVLVAIGAGVCLYRLGQRLERKEPYRSFLRLRIRQKLVFFRAVMSDPRVPLWLRLAPVLLVVYLASPVDLVPDFLPVIGYVDDVALVLAVLGLVLRFAPRDVVDASLERASKRG